MSVQNVKRKKEKMLKIKLRDTIESAMIKMSERNPGALTVLMILIKEDEMNVIKYVLALDALEIYGSNIYILWNDCCGRDVSKVKDIIDSWQSGNLLEEDIHKAIETSTPIEIQKKKEGKK